LILTFLAHDEEGTMRLIKRTTESEAPNVSEEWDKAIKIWREKVPLLGDLTLVGALTVGENSHIQWYPDVGEIGAEFVGRVLH
jgi:hypothetical protein